MSEKLQQLAAELGINDSYDYFCNGQCCHNKVDDALLRYMIEDFGYRAKNDEEIEKSLARVEKKRWQRAMEAVYVVREEALRFDVVLKETEFEGDIVVSCVKEGKKKSVELVVEFEVVARREEGHNTYLKVDAQINNQLEIGYYELQLETNQNVYHTLLAVAPESCYSFAKDEYEKLFGTSVQLYSLKSQHNWGIGDFGDLEKLVEIVSASGGDVIGLNPLNVLHLDYPEEASPYASISRLFLNPMYIDIERVPLYLPQDKDEKLVAQAKASENIEYTKVAEAKMKALKAIYQRLKRDKKSPYAKAFDKFQNEGGRELQQLAVFQTICAVKAMQKNRLSAQEERVLTSAAAGEVEKFAIAHQDDITFLKFLQFEADRQLRLVQQKVKKCGMKIGLYRDLPVGVSKNSAEVWCDKYLYMQKSGAGAPPDSYFPTGQKWGLGAFNPIELKERGYKPFIKILRANMRYAGAVRIDHIMGLSRLFLIPDDGDGGTYIRYHAKDMMNILALESQRNHCAVVGECIGNVEAGYSESLLKRNIYLLGVLWSERVDENGTMKKPQSYETKYFASVGTHDMPPLKAWWYGREIATLGRLGLYTDAEMQRAYQWREHERRLLLKALDEEQVWPQDKLRRSDYLYGEGYPEGIEEAVHAYMAKTNSEVFMFMPEDVFGSERIQNLPGTDIDKYPNWRSKQVFDLETMADSSAYQRHINIIKKWRS